MRPPSRSTLFPYTTLFRSLAGIGNGSHIDHLGRRQAALDVADACFHHALLLAGGMILGVLLQVSQLSRLGNGGGDLRTHHRLEVLELFLEGAGALNGHGILHAYNLSCRSCRRRTARSGPNFSAMQTA